MFRKYIKVLWNLRAWPHKRHVAQENIKQLRYFIQFGLAQEASKRKHAGIVFQGYESGTHLGAVLHHCCELVDPKSATTFAYTGLNVKYLMLAGQLQDEHD